MRKITTKGRCEKRNVKKCEEICRTYNPIQRAYVSKLEENKDVINFRVNVPLQGDLSAYSTDFVCEMVSGDISVRECIKAILYLNKFV